MNFFFIFYHSLEKKNGEIKKIFDRKQGVSIELSYNKNGSEKSEITKIMNKIHPAVIRNIPNIHLQIKESFEYDADGNRTAKTTAFGKIEYSYGKENELLCSGSHGKSYVNYTYDKNGNLLSRKSVQKTSLYAYDARNRLIWVRETDDVARTDFQTSYAYDYFGRRIITADKNADALRSVYDGFSFEKIKESPVTASGIFTDANEKGIRFSRNGSPTGERYRYIEDARHTSDRYRKLDGGEYSAENGRYRGARTAFCVNGRIFAAAEDNTQTSYFASDILGSVISSSDKWGKQTAEYSYDAFGKIFYSDDFDNTSSFSGTKQTASGTASSGLPAFGYLGKQLDATSEFYDYGFRDYSPTTARFTTVDPIRDGSNWFAYCNSDPVNFVDLWGLFFLKRTSDYRMSDSPWGNEITGNGVDNAENSEKGFLRLTGCAITEMSNVITSATGKNTTPKMINDDKSNFETNTDNLLMKKLAEDNDLIFDYWTKEVQEANGNSLGAKLSELKNSEKAFYISAQVKYDREGHLHWVGIADIETKDDGKTYIKVAPTSVFDTQKSSRPRESWSPDTYGFMWIETSEINKIYTYEKIKNK